VKIKTKWNPVEITLDDELELKAMICLIDTTVDTVLLKNTTYGVSGRFLVTFRDELSRQLLAEQRRL
jgi:hypothetical protein